MQEEGENMWIPSFIQKGNDSSWFLQQNLILLTGGIVIDMNQYFYK